MYPKAENKICFLPLGTIKSSILCPNVTHLIKMSRVPANYIVGKTGKYDQKSLFAHFGILLEMGTEICL